MRNFDFQNQNLRKFDLQTQIWTLINQILTSKWNIWEILTLINIILTSKSNILGNFDFQTENLGFKNQMLILINLILTSIANMLGNFDFQNQNFDIKNQILTSKSNILRKFDLPTKMLASKTKC